MTKQAVNKKNILGLGWQDWVLILHQEYSQQCLILSVRKKGVGVWGAGQDFITLFLCYSSTNSIFERHY